MMGASLLLYLDDGSEFASVPWWWERFTSVTWRWERVYFCTLMNGASLLLYLDDGIEFTSVRYLDDGSEFTSVPWWWEQAWPSALISSWWADGRGRTSRPVWRPSARPGLPSLLQPTYINCKPVLRIRIRIQIRILSSEVRIRILLSSTINRK